MNTEDPIISKKFTSLLIIYGALLGGQIMFGGVAFFIKQESNADLANVFLYVVPALLISTYMIGQFLYRQMSARAKGTEGDALMLQKYQTACLVKWAMLEGANLYACVALLLTGEINFLYLLAIGVLLFVLNRPSKEQLGEFGS